MKNPGAHGHRRHRGLISICLKSAAARLAGTGTASYGVLSMAHGPRAARCRPDGHEIRPELDNICRDAIRGYCYPLGVVRDNPRPVPSPAPASPLDQLPRKMKPKAIVSSDDRRSELEKLAFALSKTCPIERLNPRNCPLFDLRPLGARDRRSWIRQLTLDELEYLATYHYFCATEKTWKCRSRRPRKIPAAAPIGQAR